MAMEVDDKQPETSTSGDTSSLFIPDSDDEMAAITDKLHQKSFASSDAEMESVAGLDDGRSSSPNGEGSNVKKRKSHFFVNSDDEHDDEEVDLDKILDPAAFKNRQRKKDQTYATPDPDDTPDFVAAYLGEFIIDDAYTTLSGKGHIKPGDEVFIIRDLPFAEKKGKKGKGAVKVEGSTSAAVDKKGKASLKQGKLNFSAGSVKKAPLSGKAKEDNVIVRFENKLRIGVFPVGFLIIASDEPFQKLVDCPPNTPIGWASSST
jgi:DNA repair protein RAD5